MPRYKLIVEYDGSNYAGWQRQTEHPSIQQALEDAVFKISGERAEVFAAGRTDAGVHALAQVAHIDLNKEFKPYNLQQGLNMHLLPAPISILAAEEVPQEFHARFSATGRRYSYRIINRSARLALDVNRAWLVPQMLDVEAMNNAAQLLVGHHDFTTFRDTECQAASPVKTLDLLKVERLGDEIRVHASARSFLHHQVRNMVGSLALVGRGKWQKADLQKALEAKDRRAGGPTAPADGLYLVEVRYDAK